ncbi:DUF2264 domain-containing protein [Phytoactinopolyspora halotolerans]|uniref:DUF2264 domain-containing protein n=2 Tax=Phytoactinopolyspora halotolerans TaxID=1981512 RepID=A0A6L9SEP8_9ACTN|nr:DUF2264 domain-containing protein [Phytoactinopolyspora halotolerans]
METVSPITGWTREHWTELADRMLLAVRPYASPGHALIVPPGAVGGYGHRADGLEGFARTFLLAGFRLAGSDGADPDDIPGLAEWYAEGIAAGTDPASPERWIRPDEHGQAKVEAASIALILDMTRPWIWDRLSPSVQERVVAYLATVVGDDGYPRCNWVWFRIVVETFLRSVGGPWSSADIEADLAAHDSFYRQDGWFADGDERSFDHYVGWALHLYPILWSRMRGADGTSSDVGLDLAADRRETDRQRLSRFLTDYVRMIGADGSPLIQGRSLIYRFAAAAPLWAGAIAGVDTASPGRLRRAASGIVRHFAENGAPDKRGLLTMGWHHEWRRLAQSYSGPSSPYWAAKGMLGLALPADHPVWTSEEEELPVERDDEVWAAPAPGWLANGTRGDGIVRVINHGTDHAVVGAQAGDSPLYARLGYSTATAPLMSEHAWQNPVDQTAGLLDADGRATHRAGMRTLRTEVLDTPDGSRTAVGASVARARWITPPDGPVRDHGSGRAGSVRDAAAVTTVSIVRDGWEVRCVRVDPLPDAPDAITAAVRLRIGGWPLVVADGADVADGTATVRAPRAVSTVLAVRGFDDAGVHREDDASMLGSRAAVPWVSGPVRAGRWSVVVVGLHGEVPEPPVVVLLDDTIPKVRITWSEGHDDEIELERAPAAQAPERPAG